MSSSLERPCRTTVARLRQRRQRILNVAFESRSRRLHDDEILEAPTRPKTCRPASASLSSSGARRSIARKLSGAAFHPANRCSQAFPDTLTSACETCGIAAKRKSISSFANSSMHSADEFRASEYTVFFIVSVGRILLLSPSVKQLSKSPCSSISTVHSRNSCRSGRPLYTRPSARAICRIDFRRAQSSVQLPRYVVYPCGLNSSGMWKCVSPSRTANVICTIGYSPSISCAAK